jgi:hypothetical protein
MEDTMTQDDCKLITEKLLGECWHEENVLTTTWPCHKCGVEPCHNRTFTTPQDFFACFEKLVELGEWDESFGKFCLEQEMETYPQSLSEAILHFSKWVISRTESGHYRLCCLIAEWLKEK